MYAGLCLAIRVYLGLCSVFFFSPSEGRTMAAGLFLVVVLSLFSLFAANDELAGSPENIDPNNQDVLKAATFAVNSFNQQSRKDYEYKLVKVVSAKSQVQS